MIQPAESNSQFAKCAEQVRIGLALKPRLDDAADGRRVRITANAVHELDKPCLGDQNVIVREQDVFSGRLRESRVPGIRQASGGFEHPAQRQRRSEFLEHGIGLVGAVVVDHQQF